jgi:hypothetical protein
VDRPIPVVLGLDYTQPAQYHDDLAEELSLQVDDETVSCFNDKPLVGSPKMTSLWIDAKGRHNAIPRRASTAAAVRRWPGRGPQAAG